MSERLSFPAPTHPLSTNEANRLHWGQRKAYLDPWKEAAYYYAKQARLRSAEPSYIQLHLPFKTGHRRDPSNYVGTVVKAVVDGLVLAGVWPDDDARWVTVVEPTCTTRPDVEIVITPRESQQ